MGGSRQRIQGTKTALIPPGSEPMERRRQRLHEPVKAASCYDTHDEPAQTAAPKSRKRLASLAVVS
jgi:hypothetical protein